MGFALELEQRDLLDKLIQSNVSNPVNAKLSVCDFFISSPPVLLIVLLQENISLYTAGAFFSPDLPYYLGPKNSVRSKNLNNLVLVSYASLVCCRAC
jgi:hypothetical protein